MKIRYQRINNNPLGSIRLGLLALLLLAAIGFSLWQWLESRAQNEVNCTAPFYVNESLPNGGRWELCWEHRSRDGIVLRDIIYTTPKGVRRPVLTEASISQVHVPYDDNSARFHDITDDGFGGRNLADLTEAECSGGTLLPYEGKNVLCQQIAPRGHAWKSGSGQQQGYALNLFNVSTSGEYNYIPLWRFWDDGTIEPIMGASGRLQRFDTGGPHSWPIRANDVSGISHIHNYYWRLDFDLGESGTDDVVEELDWVPAQAGQGRSLSVSALETESSRSVEPGVMRSWRIRDAAPISSTVAAAQSNGIQSNGIQSSGIQSNGGLADQPIGYRVEPLSLGHRDVGPSFEPWTHHDLFVTTYNECERYVSHNPAFSNCGTDVTDFVDGESLVDEDLVLWYGVTFHHVPRDEDEVNMHTHWDGFQIAPMNWTTTNELVPEETAEPSPTTDPVEKFPPVASFTTQPITGTAPLTVTFDASTSSDPDGEIVAFDWTFGSVSTLSGSLGANKTGISVTHQYTLAGSYPVTLTVTDNDGLTAQTSQIFVVAEANREPCDLGDVNCDGEATIVDALFILQHHQGSREASESRTPLLDGTLYGPACDVTNNGQCDLDDAMTIFECSTGLVNDFCQMPWQATASAEEVQLFKRLLERVDDLYLPLIQ